VDSIPTGQNSCNTIGFLSKKIANYFKSFAYEISEYAKNNIRINSPATKIIVNDFQNKYFDGIVSLHCFEHLENPEETLNILKFILKKNGKLMISFPNISSIFLPCIWEPLATDYSLPKIFLKELLETGR
jgi:2-polyprenyl-3-methyl-5-hydroxy-6-metoxy-1,4-benzoquinol methylase